MLPISSDAIRRLRVPGYFVMTTLTSLPIIELFASAWPAQFHLAQWRFSMASVAGATAITALLGLYFIYWIAVAAGDKGVVWIVSSICGVAAVACIGAAGLFPLDALQMKSAVRADLLTRFAAASIVAMLKICFAGVAYGVLSVSAFKTASRFRTEGARERNSGSPLVVGQSTARG